MRSLRCDYNFFKRICLNTTLLDHSMYKSLEVYQHTELAHPHPTEHETQDVHAPYGSPGYSDGNDMTCPHGSCATWIWPITRIIKVTLRSSGIQSVIHLKCLPVLWERVTCLYKRINICQLALTGWGYSRHGNAHGFQWTWTWFMMYSVQINKRVQWGFNRERCLSAARGKKKLNSPTTCKQLPCNQHNSMEGPASRYTRKVWIVDRGVKIFNYTTRQPMHINRIVPMKHNKRSKALHGYHPVQIQYLVVGWLEPHRTGDNQMQRIAFHFRYTFKWCRLKYSWNLMITCGTPRGCAVWFWAHRTLRHTAATWWVLARTDWQIPTIGKHTPDVLNEGNKEQPGLSKHRQENKIIMFGEVCWIWAVEWEYVPTQDCIGSGN